jgi:hypothetical protein
MTILVQVYIHHSALLFLKATDNPFWKTFQAFEQSTFSTARINAFQMYLLGVSMLQHGSKVEEIQEVIQITRLGLEACYWQY